MQKLFCYGSLMLPKIREHLLQKTISFDPAILKGYRRFKVKGRTYPGIVEDIAEEVRGQVIYPLTDLDLKKLDEYEGIEYLRKEVDVYNEVTEQIEVVLAYVYKESLAESITNVPWDLSQLDIQADLLMD